MYIQSTLCFSKKIPVHTAYDNFVYIITLHRPFVQSNTFLEILLIEAIYKIVSSCLTKSKLNY